MAAKTLICDECGLEMPAADARRDIGSEQDLCVTHYRQRKLEQAKADRKHLQDWLDLTHLKRLRELDAEIAELASGLPFSE
jgi:hypothetical protein